MRSDFVILESVRGYFQKSANRTIRVHSAWRREDSTLEQPAQSGSDGWTHVGKPATREVILGLRDSGFTWVNLEASGVADKHKDVSISHLV
ncbi:hypothetical protein ACTXIX_16620 [Glutamicibacter ardleyensis]|uniref:hypothetical protein n=1 Tax=Glutamicibacter ardleyensis TaxID=225894 RepID=UPI003F9118B7